MLQLLLYADNPKKFYHLLATLCIHLLRKVAILARKFCHKWPLEETLTKVVVIPPSTSCSCFFTYKQIQRRTIIPLFTEIIHWTKLNIKVEYNHSTAWIFPILHRIILLSIRLHPLHLITRRCSSKKRTTNLLPLSSRNYMSSQVFEGRGESDDLA